MIPASTIEFAGKVFIRRGDKVLDLGCGSGYLAIEAARRGAGEVWATDIDASCVSEADAAGRALGLHAACGDLFEPVLGKRFDVIVTNPPQTPFPPGVEHPKSGGPRGLRLFERIAREARAFLVPRGRLYFMSISLVPRKELLALFEPDFAVSQIGESKRPCSRGEYEALHPGLWEYLRRCELYDGYFLNRFFMAQPRA